MQQGQVFVRIADSRRTVAVDLKIARSVEALKAHLQDVLQFKSSSFNKDLTLCLNGRIIRKSGDLRQKLHQGDTVWLTSSSLRGGSDDNFVRAENIKPRRREVFEETQENLFTPRVSPREEQRKFTQKHPQTGNLQTKCLAKCLQMKLFTRAIKDNDDLVRVIEEYFSQDDMKRILSISQKGYNESDLEDKIDFYNRLPEEIKQRVMDEFNQKNPMFFKVKQQFLAKNKTVKELAQYAQSMTEYAIERVQKFQQAESILYQMPRNQNQDDEKCPKLSVKSESDRNQIREMGDLPQPTDELDYDYMQLQRLLDKQTLYDIETDASVISTSVYTQALRTKITGNMQNLLLENYCYDPNKDDAYNKERIKSIRNQIIQVFSTIQTDNKFADKYPKEFATMAEMPEVQKAFEERLLEQEFLEKYFLHWNKIISNPQTCKSMVRLLETFSKKTQVIFYRRLAQIMSRCDFLNEGTKYTPELLALIEKESLIEVMLDKPAFDKSKSKSFKANFQSLLKKEVRRFWITDYPVLCYLKYDKNGMRKELVMTHLADAELPQKVFRLDVNEKFIQFVDQTQTQHNASIKVLVHNEHSNNLIIKSYLYLNPNKKKQFDSSEEWETSDEFKFELKDELTKVFNDNTITKRASTRFLKSSPRQNNRRQSGFQLLSPRIIEAIPEADHDLVQPRKISMIKRKDLKALVIQTEENIYFYDLQMFELNNLIDQQSYVKHEMLRGLQDSIYFVRRDSGGDSIQKLKVKAVQDQLIPKVVQVNAPYSGKILIFELDPLNGNDVESSYQNNDILDEWQDKADNIFVIDESLNLFKLEIAREIIVKTQMNLSTKNSLKSAIEQGIRGKDFVRVCISDRCISILGKTYSFRNDTNWNFVYNSTADTQDKKQQITLIENMPFSHLQIALLQQGDRSALVIKNDPSSRKICTLDRRRKDVLLMEMLHENMMLVKLKGDSGHNYWAIIDTLGDIQALPIGMNEILEQKNWTSLQIKQLKTKVEKDKPKKKVVQSSSFLNGNDDSDPEDYDGCYLIVLSEYDRTPKPKKEEKKKEINNLRLSLKLEEQKTENNIKQNINPLPNIATILLDRQAKRVLRTTFWTQDELEQKIGMLKDDKVNIVSQGIFFKIIVTEENKIYLLYSNPIMIKARIMTTKFDEDDKEKSLRNKHLKTNLEVIVLNGTMKSYFQNQESALIIQGIIYLVGQTKKLLRLKKDKEGEFYVYGLKPKALPYPGECIITTCSPFYRCNNTTVELQKDNSLIYPDQIQINYPDRVFVCEVDQVRFMQSKKHGYFEEHLGSNIMFNPEKYVDGGYTTSKLVTEMSEDQLTEVVKIWSHINANKSKDYYYVYSNWWWKNSTPEDIGKKRDYAFLGFYRKYSEADLFEVMRLKDHIKVNKALKNFENEILFSSFFGQTVFHIFYSDLQMLNLISEYLDEGQGLEPEEDLDKNDLENQELRRIYYQLACHEIDKPEKANFDPILSKKHKQAQEQEQTAKVSKCREWINSFIASKQSNDDKLKPLNCNSILYQILHSKMSKDRDQILRIANFCQNFTLHKIFITQDDVKALLRTPSPQVVNALDNILKETRYTKRIITLDTSRELNMVTYQSDRFKLEQKDAQHYYEQRMKEKHFETEDMFPSSVKIHLMDLNWLERKDKDFLYLVKTLKETNNRAILQTKFVSTLLDGFWYRYNRKILWTQFVPFLCYLISINCFMAYALQYDIHLEHGRADYDIVYYPLLGFVTMFIINQFKCEVHQLRSADWNLNEHFSSFWNINDLIYLILNVLVLISNINDWPFRLATQRQISACATLFLWFKMLDWMRLFDRTVFYISLFLDTMSSILYFSIILIIWYFAFGQAFYLLSLNRPEDTLVHDISPIWIFDGFESMYELGLGEFNLSEFYRPDDKGNRTGALCYIFFVLATILIMIVFLNMLIAIMGDTFANNIQEQDINSCTEQIRIMDEASPLIKDFELEGYFAQNKDDKEHQGEQSDEDEDSSDDNEDGVANVDVNADQNEKEQEARKSNVLYVVITDEENTADTQSWEGSLIAMKNLTEQAIETSHDKLDRKLISLKQSIALAEMKETGKDRSIKTTLNRMLENLTNLTQNMNNLTIDVQSIKANQRQEFEEHL